MRIKPWQWWCAAAFIGVGSCASIAQQAVPAIDFNKEIAPILDAHCSQCHGAKKQKGGVNFDLVTDTKTALKNRKMLRLAIDAIDLRDMPPEGEKQLSPEDRTKLLAWLGKTATLDCNDPMMRDPGPAPMRRLNRDQYDLTIRDLVGIEFNAGETVGLPDDLPVTGYSTFANSLTMPAAQMEKYFTASDVILDVLFDSQNPDKPRDRKAQEAKIKAQAAYKALFIALPDDRTQPRDAAAKIIDRFATLAFRRPVTAQERDRLLALFDASQKRSEPFAQGVRWMLKGVLVSPHFLMRMELNASTAIEAKPGAAIPAQRVSDHELATRLSYFLWSTMPDAELFALAAANKLHDETVLAQQVKRMLADPKARSLTDHFAVQWLQLHKLDNARPSTEFFPTFSRKLRDAMREETLLFFDGLRTGDRPILDLLDADYTYVNQDLARHYQIESITGPQMQRITLKPEHHRGGLLGMGSILAMTSHTSRTSPTLRGKWVLDVIYGTPPPPPPANVGEVKEDKNSKEPRSFRELLGQHASRTECAMCHKKMDPLGFALDSFDAIGSWRDSHGGKPLDTTGKLPTGESFNGPMELKKIILAQKEQFIRNLSEQMLSYALGRELDYFDECVVNHMVAKLAKNEHRFSALVLAVVQSYPFQFRRVLTQQGE